MRQRVADKKDQVINQAQDLVTKSLSIMRKRTTSYAGAMFYLAVKMSH